MKTVQMTLDESLIKEVDRVTKKLRTSRSEFTRQALRDALDRYRVEQLERRHRQGYDRRPVAEGEFDAWETEQEWGDA